MKNFNQFKEEKESKNYHSIWYKTKDGNWSNHFDADSHEDAKAEMESLRNRGEKVKKILVPKDQADWSNQDHKAAAIKKLDEAIVPQPGQVDPKTGGNWPNNQQPPTKSVGGTGIHQPTTVSVPNNQQPQTQSAMQNNQQQNQNGNQPKQVSLSSLAPNVKDMDWHTLHGIFTQQYKGNHPEAQQLGAALLNAAQTGNMQGLNQFKQKYIWAQKA